jgi:hypothetical protein
VTLPETAAIQVFIAPSDIPSWVSNEFLPIQNRPLSVPGPCQSVQLSKSTRHKVLYNTSPATQIRRLASSWFILISTGNTKSSQSLERLASRLEGLILLDESQFDVSVGSPQGPVRDQPLAVAKYRVQKVSSPAKRSGVNGWAGIDCLKRIG